MSWGTATCAGSFHLEKCVLTKDKSDMPTSWTVSGAGVTNTFYPPNHGNRWSRMYYLYRCVCQVYFGGHDKFRRPKIIIQGSHPERKIVGDKINSQAMQVSVFFLSNISATIYMRDNIHPQHLEPFFAVWQPFITICTDTYKGMPYLYGRYVPIDGLPVLFDCLYHPGTVIYLDLIGCRNVMTSANRVYGKHTSFQTAYSDIRTTGCQVNRYSWDSYVTKLMVTRVYGEVDQLLMHEHLSDGYLRARSTEMVISSGVEDVRVELTPEWYKYRGTLLPLESIIVGPTGGTIFDAIPNDDLEFHIDDSLNFNLPKSIREVV
jgi:hypothetical protein